MDFLILLKASLKKHYRSLAGVFLLVSLISLALSSVLNIWTNSKGYVNAELERNGFGTLTAWVAGVPDTQTLIDEIAEIGRR